MVLYVPNAGVDESNVEVEFATPMPVNSDKSADKDLGEKN